MAEHADRDLTRILKIAVQDSSFMKSCSPRQNFAVPVYKQEYIDIDIKILHNLSPPYIQDLVKEKVLHYDFRNKKQVEIPQVNSKRYMYVMKSFRFETAYPSISGGCCRPGM